MYISGFTLFIIFIIIGIIIDRYEENNQNLLNEIEDRKNNPFGYDENIINDDY